MKILWLLDFLPPQFSHELGLAPQASGSWVMALLEALRRQPEACCCRICLCCYTGAVDTVQHRTIDGISYTALPTAGGKEVLRQALEEEEPDLVQLFGTENEHALWLFQLFDPEKILVYIQGIAGPCGEHMADGLPDVFLKAHPLKEALAQHTGGLTVHQQVQRFLARGEKEKKVLAKARHILGRTQWDKDYCLSINPTAQYYSLGEIMRSSFYSGGWCRDYCQPHRLFVSQGNVPLKGFHRAIEALPELCRRWPDTQLYVAGWPPPDKGPLLQPLMNWLSEYTGYLASLAKSLNVENRIHYTGVLDETGMRQQLMAAETFLLCSSIENSPNSLGEAMLMGLPCAASAVGGVPSMMEPGQGILFDPESKGSLAAAVTALWEDTPNADQLGRAARLRALDAHDPARIAREQVKIYEEIAGL